MADELFHTSSSLDTVQKGAFLKQLVTLYIYKMLETVFFNGIREWNFSPCLHVSHGCCYWRDPAQVKGKS